MIVSWVVEVGQKKEKKAVCPPHLLEQPCQPCAEGIIARCSDCILAESIPLPDGAWEEGHGSVIVSAKFPHQLSVIWQYTFVSSWAIDLILQVIFEVHAHILVQCFV